jgi:hypothetical protein
MKQHRLIALFAVLFSALLVISDASAQFGGGGGVFGGSRSGGKSGRGSDSQGSGSGSRNERQVTSPDSNSYDQIDYRLSLLQEDLKLKTEQNDAWQLFASKTRAYAGDLARERARLMQTSYANTAQTNALQHIGQSVDAAQNRLTALQDVESSAKVLYQTLTPEQKNLADMRIPTIIAPRPTAPGGNNAGSNLPDLGSSAKPSR